MVFIYALYVQIREGQVADHPIYVVIDINCDGARDVLGLRVGTGPVGTGCHRPMTERSLSSDHICCQVTVRSSSSQMVVFSSTRPP
ncbi:hypothetical protein GCM10009629_28620 [Pseudonocardia alni]|uniref:transposase n=1 Tax=Pseudonocardia alni TaxID=33907 RepID=UPI0015C95FAD